MNKHTIAKLAKKGWKVGTVAEFLELSPEEAVYVEMKVALASRLQHLRQSRRISQEQLATLIHSSRSNISKIENNDPTASIDLLVRSLLALGSSPDEVAQTISLRSAP